MRCSLRDVDRRDRAGRYGLLIGVGLSLAAMVVMPAPASGGDAMSEQLDERLQQPLKPHPRLFLCDDRLRELRRRLAEDDLLRSVWGVVEREAGQMLEQEPVQRQQVGRRLLGVSRTVLKRVSYLALAYRQTGERRYLERAEREMLAAAGFADWNPSHFLDVAEMTAALAIGYDWLHDDLDEQARATIREAIISKGLRAGFDHAGWWVTTTNNWSQVCHGGLTMGALAVMEHEPRLARRTIVRALEHIHRPMDVYGPNGAYPEGPGYWSYGTVFNVMLIDALATALGDDFGLSAHERFMASADYYMHMHGPTLLQFNYSDNSEHASIAPEVFWFARQLERPQLLWTEQRKLERFLADARASGPRTLPLLLVWAGSGGEITAPAAPAALHYRDDGPTPVATHRSGWDADAVYVGLKAGTPRANHGQMDIGSFVMEADGVRWAIDLGKQDYHSLESVGLNLWNRSQDSDRWRVFRLNNHSKNTLVVDGELQRVAGFAPITAFSEEGPRPHTVIDMTEVYQGQLASAKRGVQLLGDRGVLVRDQIAAGQEGAQVRWGMLTRAEVEIVDPRRAALSQDGKRLGLRVVEPEGAQLELIQTADPPGEHDAPNLGTRMVGFTLTLEPGQSQALTVVLQRGGPGEQDVEAEPLDHW